MDPRSFPTKGNLILAKNSLTLARQGYELMDKKRNILIRELMGLIDEAKDIQEEIDKTFTYAYQCLQRANIEHGISTVEELAYTVPIEDSIRIQTRSIMGTEIPKVMYGEKEKAAKAVEYKHMTFYEAANLAKEAEVGEMWLTHYSPSLRHPEEYMDEVRAIFPHAIAGKDRMTTELDFPE